MAGAATVPEVPGFTLAGEAAARVVEQHALRACLAALRAVKPIIADLLPEPGGAPDPDVSKAARLVAIAIKQAEAVQ